MMTVCACTVIRPNSNSDPMPIDESVMDEQINGHLVFANLMFTNTPKSSKFISDLT